tara:strand:- start:2616 stop:2897 length:282 start_codon:yes stop_codon:yes gene_type:complete
MKKEKKFINGILIGSISVILLFIIMGANTNEKSTAYEFYDLQDTRGLIFNKYTGEIKYEEIREKPLFVEHYHNLSSWNGQPPGDGSYVKHITP